jgi:hypothetical protein
LTFGYRYSYKTYHKSPFGEPTPARRFFLRVPPLDYARPTGATCMLGFAERGDTGFYGVCLLKILVSCSRHFQIYSFLDRMSTSKKRERGRRPGGRLPRSHDHPRTSGPHTPRVDEIHEEFHGIWEYNQKYRNPDFLSGTTPNTATSVLQPLVSLRPAGRSWRRPLSGPKRRARL